MKIRLVIELSALVLISPENKILIKMDFMPFERFNLIICKTKKQRRGNIVF